METFYIKEKSRTEYSCCTTYHPFLTLLITNGGRSDARSKKTPIYRRTVLYGAPSASSAKGSYHGVLNGSRSTRPMTCNRRQLRRISSFSQAKYLFETQTACSTRPRWRWNIVFYGEIMIITRKHVKSLLSSAIEGLPERRGRRDRKR